jgi:hypothetical protein
MQAHSAVGRPTAGRRGTAAAAPAPAARRGAVPRRAAALPRLLPWPAQLQRRGCYLAPRAQLQPQHQHHAAHLARPGAPYAPRHAPQQARSGLRRKQPPAVVYIPNFLHPDDAETIVTEYRRLR